MSVPIITQRYKVFSYMIEMLLDHSLDSARQVHTIVSMHMALQSYIEIQGLIEKIGAGGATEIRGQFACARRHVRFQGAFGTKSGTLCQSWGGGGMAPLPPPLDQLLKYYFFRIWYLCILRAYMGRGIKNPQSHPNTARWYLHTWYYTHAYTEQFLCFCQVPENAL